MEAEPAARNSPPDRTPRDPEGAGKGGEGMKRKLAVSFLAMALGAASAAPAFADPSFGPGNKGGGEGNAGPQGAKCHPPGQTTTTPGCK